MAVFVALSRHFSKVVPLSIWAFATALAVTPGAVIAQQQPGDIAAPTRDELRPLTQPPQQDGARLSVEGDIERSACPLAAPEYADIRLDITSVRFNNLQGVDPALLRPAYAPYLGTNQPVAAICDIRDAAATLLRREGYLAAVQVPTQRIENGEVQMEVLFGKVVAVRVRGDAGPTERLIESYLEKLTRDPLFNRFTAERYLLLARDLPGLDVRMTLTPAGGAPGELIGEITVRRQAYRVDFELQNLASRPTGHFGARIAAEAYGLTGMGDRSFVSAYTTMDFEEQQVIQLGHDFALGGEGLRLGGQFTYAWTQPDIGAVNVANPVKAETLFATVNASYPLIRSQAFSLLGNVGLDLADQDVRFGPTPLSRDRIRTGFLRLAAEAQDIRLAGPPRYRFGGEIELRKGLDILGASEPCDASCFAPNQTRTPLSRPDGDPTFTLLRASADIEIALSQDIAAYFHPYAQIAFDPLIGFEEFSGGNYTVGRGYDPGSISGDDGFGVQFELRGPRYSPFKDKGLGLQPFVFTDAAWAWDNARTGANDPQRLVSVGGGVRARYRDRIRFDVALAAPLERVGPLQQRGDVRLLFTLATKLLPWAW